MGKNLFCLGGQRGDMLGTSLDTVATLDAVRMEIAQRLIFGCVWLQLHGTNAGTHLALDAALAGVYILETLWQSVLMRCHPTRDATHRTEITPCAGGIDKVEHHTHDSRHEDDVPEYLSHSIPVAPAHIQLYAKHHKDEENHKESESETLVK